MVFGNGVKYMQAAAYNGAHSVFYGSLGTARCSVYLISVPDQPGRKRMYHFYIRGVFFKYFDKTYPISVPKTKKNNIKSQIQ